MSHGDLLPRCTITVGAIRIFGHCLAAVYPRCIEILEATARYKYSLVKSHHCPMSIKKQEITPLSMSIKILEVGCLWVLLLVQVLQFGLRIVLQGRTAMLTHAFEIKRVVAPSKREAGFEELRSHTLLPDCTTGDNSWRSPSRFLYLFNIHNIKRSDFVRLRTVRTENKSRHPSAR